MMPVRFNILLIAFVAITELAVAPAMAETFWLSEPGLCNADDGEIEEIDVIYLTKRGIESHYFSCQWPSKAGRAILRGGQSVSTKANCANATSTWVAELEIVQQGDGSVRVFQQTGGISPVRFFRCN